MGHTERSDDREWVIWKHPAIASMREAVMRASKFGTAAAFEALHEDGWEVVASADHQGAVEAERKRIAQYVRGRGTDDWNPQVEGALAQVASEIERNHHHGGR